MTVFCRSLHVAASVREMEYAIADGVEFLYGMRPVEITDEGVVYRKATFDEEGNIASLSEPMLYPATTGLEMTDHGLLATDSHGQTTRPGIFASGDVVLGARTVVEAVRYSKQVADEMDAYLQQLAAEQSAPAAEGAKP